MEKKVLIVDDAKVVRMALKGIMRKIGWKATEAENGKIAMETMQEDPSFSLILLDWNMPEMNGYDFLTWLRSVPEHSENPRVIMVTTESSMPSMLQALAAGADEYIMKPFDADMIRDKMLQIGVDA